MKVLTCKQGSAEWHLARLGIPTASQFGRIMTPKTRKLAAGADKYMHELLAEWLIGIPHGGDARGYIARGSEMEPWARRYYELQRGVTVQQVGCVLTDDGLAAGSPDGLIEADGGMELKVPSASQHVANLLDMQEDYFAQVQGNLWITGRKWWDLVSYHPEMPAALVRFERDEQFIADLDKAMQGFTANLLAARAKLIGMGAEPATSLAAEFVATIEATPEVVETI